MTCEEIQDRLDEYVDGTLGEAEFQEVELHLAACPACRGEERLLRALLARAETLPEELDPPRDLWPEIRARLPRAPGRAGRAWWSNPGLLAAAAAVVVAVGAAMALRRAGTPLPRSEEARLARVAVTTSSEGLVDAEREYARATAELMAALDRQKASLAPETVKTVTENLATIDEALAQVRAALRKDPGNPQLTRMLTSTHRKKLDALQRVVRLNRL